jgi:hypothetical protein
MGTLFLRMMVPRWKFFASSPDEILGQMQENGANGRERTAAFIITRFEVLLKELREPIAGRRTMISLTIDTNDRISLREAKELAEIWDTEENVLGFFVLADLYKAHLDVEADRNTDFVKILQGKYVTRTAHTTRQVFEHLKTLTDDEMTRLDLQKTIDRLVAKDKDFISRI